MLSRRLVSWVVNINCDPIGFVSLLLNIEISISKKYISLQLMMCLEERITRLEDIEAIRQLQARYQRCLDTRNWEEMGCCFTEDASSAYGNGSMAYRGREAILTFLKGAMSLKMPSTHLIHGGEIEVDGTAASGIWYLEDYLLHRIFKLKLHGAAIYHVDYRKEEGCWKICRIGYERCYEYFEFRGLLNQFTLRKTTFLDRLKKKRR